MVAPRHLALLALVAAAGRQGLSRDRAIAILWPEAGEEQARHALSQTLYSLRRSAGRDLIIGTAQLRLDPSLGSDIGELRSASQAGDLEAVASLYHGRFLDGFHLPDAPGFERWVEDERTGLEREVLRALERLAKLAEQEKRSADAVRWWQRLGELDRLSAPYALGHMRALAASGDRTGALTRARLYREVVRRELDADPDPAIEQLDRTLRALPPERHTPPAALPAAPSPSHHSPPPVPQTQRRVGWFLVAAVPALTLLALALITRSRRPASPPFLAVGEIRLEGVTDSSLSGRVIRDMLATTLGGVTGLQVLANSRLVELMPRGPNPPPTAITDAARRAGASEIVEGELSAEASGFQLSLRRVTLARGVVRKGYVVRATDRSALVDSATAAIARDLGLDPPSVTVTQTRTASPAAYALYDEGLRAYFGYDAPAAYRLMKAAFERDSGFAMAAFYVWHLSNFLGDAETSTRILPYVQQLALKTIERERLLIQLSIAAEGLQPTYVLAALAETLTVKYPRDPDGQILLGQARGSQGDWAGSIVAYERAFQLDSAAGALSRPQCRGCRAIAFQVIAYNWSDSLAAAERSARRLIALRPNDLGALGGPWNNLVETLLRQGRRQEAAAAQQKSPNSLSTGEAWQVFQRDLIRWGNYEQADRELIAGITSPNEDIRPDAWWLLLLSLRDQGRLREADTLIHQWRVANTNIKVPDAGPPAVDFALLGLEQGRPDVSIRAHRENLATMANWTPPAHRARNLSWQLVLAGTAYAAAGDTAVLRRLVDSLETLGQASNYAGRDGKLHFVLRGLLLQREGRHAEAVDAFRRSFYSVSDGYTRTNLMMARSLLELHRPQEAIAVLRPAIHGGVDGSNTYVSRTELHEALAQAFEQASELDSARVHWRAVASAWQRADPQFRDRYQRARQKAGG